MIVVNEPERDLWRTIQCLVKSILDSILLPVQVLRLTNKLRDDQCKLGLITDSSFEFGVSAVSIIQDHAVPF